MDNKKIKAVLYAIAAAVFYALNVPCSKLMLDKVPPTIMAGILYLGAGIGVGTMYLFHFKKEKKSDRLARADFPYTVGMVLLDIAAPILLMIGVKLSTSANAALLVMIVGTIFAAADTLAHSHTHEHTHTFTHTHDGSTHTHTVTHRHSHEHCISDNKHGHRHTLAELEAALAGSDL